MKKIILSFDKKIPVVNVDSIIIPDMADFEIKDFLIKKLNTDNISVLFYDNLTESSFDGYISIDSDDYNFNYKTSFEI